MRKLQRRRRYQPYWMLNVSKCVCHCRHRRHGGRQKPPHGLLRAECGGEELCAHVGVRERVSGSALYAHPISPRRPKGGVQEGVHP